MKSMFKELLSEEYKTLKEKKFNKLNWQVIIISLCLLVVCLGTQHMQTARSDSIFFSPSRDVLGVLMAIIILTHYKWSDFVRYKVPYIIWTVMGGVLCIVFTPMVIARRAEHLALDTITIALGIFLIGYCIIHTVINFWIEKYRPKFYKPLFIIWVVMLILMIFSRSEYLWPECYFVLFLCFYLTEQTPTQRTNVIKGIVNGIILGFIVIQGHSLLTRPFDRVRYYGNFCNPNDNCVFLCMCLVAILGKILILTKENKSKTIKAFCFVLAGACYSFLFMTQSRTGYLTTGIVTIFS